jgi:hypothetical protein
VVVIEDPDISDADCLLQSLISILHERAAYSTTFAIAVLIPLLEVRRGALRSLTRHPQACDLSLQ